MPLLLFLWYAFIYGERMMSRRDNVANDYNVKFAPACRVVLAVAPGGQAGRF